MSTARQFLLSRSRLAVATTAMAIAALGVVPAAGQAATARDHGRLARPALVDPLPPKVVPGDPLPRRAGTVPVNTRRTVVGSHRPNTRARAATTAVVAPATSTRKVTVRALVVAVDAGDFGLPTWKKTLDRVGAQYDVLLAGAQPLTAATLVNTDGSGKYNAILLTNSMLWDQTDSALTPSEWNTLWAYERDFAVRQATLFTSFGSWPEDYCLRQGTGEGTVLDDALPASLTSTGSSLLSHLKPSASIPIRQSYVYRNSLGTDCDGEAVLSSGTDVLGVRSTSADGRERMALTFTSNEFLLQADLLVYGLFRWASRGLHLGEQRHYLNVDVDDWFNSSDIRNPDGTINSDPGYQMTGHDAYNTYLAQTALRSDYPLAGKLKLNLAYNAGDANRSAGSTCWPNGGIDRLTATTRCLRTQFSWINHTLTHPKMNFTDFTTTYNEIKANLDVAATLGLSVPRTVLKTGEYSGLGVYHPDPTNDIDPPTDYGINASNPALLAAAKALGVKYLHGNMSFPSHRPSCFNCALVHPMEPSVMVVPDWPTNLAYFSSTPAEETSFYNSFYGPNGKFAYWPTDRTYEQIIDYEAELALLHLTSGSLYSHTLHISNLKDYGAGKTLTFDWLRSVADKYSSYYAVPLLTPAWTALADTAAARNRHFTTLGQGVRGVYDPVTNTVAFTNKSAGLVTVSGVSASTAGATSYGSEVSAPVNVRPNRVVTVTANRLP